MQGIFNPSRTPCRPARPAASTAKAVRSASPRREKGRRKRLASGASSHAASSPRKARRRSRGRPARLRATERANPQRRAPGAPTRGSGWSEPSCENSIGRGGEAASRAPAGPPPSTRNCAPARNASCERGARGKDQSSVSGRERARPRPRDGGDRHPRSSGEAGEAGESGARPGGPVYSGFAFTKNS
jgi:hypothetical protein